MLNRKYRLFFRPNRSQDGKSFSDQKKRLRTAQNDYFIVKKYFSAMPFSRFGVAVSVKVDKRAVKRNKIRRLVYGFIRQGKLHLQPGFDVLIIVLPPAKNLTLQEIRASLAGLL